MTFNHIVRLKSFASFEGFNHLFGIFLHNPKATMRTTHPIVLGASIVKKVDNVGILPVFGHTIPHTSYAIFAGVE